MLCHRRRRRRCRFVLLAFCFLLFVAVALLRLSLSLCLLSGASQQLCDDCLCAVCCVLPLAAAAAIKTQAPDAVVVGFCALFAHFSLSLSFSPFSAFSVLPHSVGFRAVPNVRRRVVVSESQKGREVHHSSFHLIDLSFFLSLLSPEHSVTHSLTHKQLSQTFVLLLLLLLSTSTALH